jgi:hypothetical protein
MKETRADIEAKLAERQARLRDLETRGVNALSNYDIQIAYSGDVEMALRMSTQLVRNHIRYYVRQLEAMPPEQGKLF